MYFDVEVTVALDGLRLVLLVSYEPPERARVFGSRDTWSPGERAGADLLGYRLEAGGDGTVGEFVRDADVVAELERAIGRARFAGNGLSATLALVTSLAVEAKRRDFGDPAVALVLHADDEDLAERLVDVGSEGDARAVCSG